MKDWFARNQKVLLRAAGSLLAIGALLLLMKSQGWSEIAAAVEQVPLDILLIGAGFTLLSRLFSAARWYVLLRAAEIRVSLWRVILLTFTGLFSSNFLPTTIGGDVVRLGAIISMGYDRARCLASLAADRLVGMSGMLLALPFGLMPIINIGAAGRLQSLPLAVLWQRGWNFLKRTFRELSFYLKRPRSLLLSLACTLGNMLCLFAAIYFLIEGLGQHADYFLVAGLYGAAYFVTLIPVSINGLGVQELSLSYLFSAAGGLPLPVSLTLAILFRAALLLTSLPGAAALPSVMGQIKGASLKEDQP